MNKSELHQEIAFGLENLEIVVQDIEAQHHAVTRLFEQMVQSLD